MLINDIVEDYKNQIDNDNIKLEYKFIYFNGNDDDEYEKKATTRI